MSFHTIRSIRSNRGTSEQQAMCLQKHHHICLRPVSRPGVAFTSGIKSRRITGSLICKAEQDESNKEAASVTFEVLGQNEKESYELSGSSLLYTPASSRQKMMISWKLLRARPWRRFKKGSVLTFKIGGEIGDQPAGLFDENYSLSQLCNAISNAAKDPRVSGIFVKITPLAVGWGRVQELRRHIEYFTNSDKFAISYMYTGGEKEYFLASAFTERYCAPSATFALRGLAVSGSFLRGVLDKVGVEPQVKRIGKYKSAGDQLGRKGMAEPQREQLSVLLDDIFSTFKALVASSVGKTVEQVQEMLDAGYVSVDEYASNGWLTGLKYEDEIIQDLEKRTESKEGKLKQVKLKKYVKLSPATFAASLTRKRIAVIRASGNITGTEPGGLTSTGITAEQVIAQLKTCRKEKSIVAVVLRVDSPGGEATASDLMWREIRRTAEQKPVVASMGDVAASGGFYMAMGARAIVAEPLTITGSIGVVTAKFNLEELYRRIGFSKEVISRGKYAEVLQESRGFTDEEEALFDRGAQRAYEEFRNKAAESRKMTPEQIEEFAQGRVWTGRRALSVGLVDYLGGLPTAVDLAKRMAGLDSDALSRVAELRTSSPSPLSVLRGASALVLAGVQAGRLAAASGSLLQGKVSAELVGEAVLSAAARSMTSPRRQPQLMAVMDDIQVVGASEL